MDAPFLIKHTGSCIDFMVGGPCCFVHFILLEDRSPHERSDMRGETPDVASLIRATILHSLLVTDYACSS